MIKFHLISLHQEFVRRYWEIGVCARAKAQNLAEFHAISLRDFAMDKHGTVDGRPFGGGDGMVLRPDVLAAAVKSIAPKPKIIVTNPGAAPFRQSMAEELAQVDQPIALVCGRFGGIDQRFIDRYVDLEVSVGSFVVSGGELPSLMIVDAIVRQIPGVLGNFESAAHDSFSEAYDGQIEHPLYTRPELFEGLEVPEVLRSGDHKAIATWRQSKRRTPS